MELKKNKECSEPVWLNPLQAQLDTNRFRTRIRQARRPWEQKLWQDKSPYWGQVGSIRQNRSHIWASIEFKELLEDEINGSTLETEIEASTAVIRKYRISEKRSSVWKFQRKKWTSQKQWGKNSYKCMQPKSFKPHPVNKADKAQNSWETFNKHHSASDSAKIRNRL